MATEIVSFPIKKVIFHSYVSHYQRIKHHEIPLNHHFPMVFLCFSHGFPMVFQCNGDGIPHGQERVWLGGAVQNITSGSHHSCGLLITGEAGEAVETGGEWRIPQSGENGGLMGLNGI